ncbi:hypothetical protein TSOC_012292 [Tetrabaena socialis]|uniref:Uncharacterized protein n=1 Tax=Tetrabaena socialis TaxID=47790 RepID=A0A2J7ZNE3_9CHLO|nr:hypothetical protein TSOC_012292 [Tetrabaena socialis]|eukprot:PNH01793.1 hypothetical protein TSOC_012292 [Tetrabaena socialis]
MSTVNRGPLDQFYKDCLRVGCLKASPHSSPVTTEALPCPALGLPGTPSRASPPPPFPPYTHTPPQCFTHFQLYLKGREELVVTIYTGSQVSSPRTLPTFRAINAGYSRWYMPSGCAAGSIASFLRELLLSSCQRPDLVQQDFQECVSMHFQLMPRLTPLTPGTSAAAQAQAANGTGQQQQQH